jgi:hypothetical protein
MRFSFKELTLVLSLYVLEGTRIDNDCMKITFSGQFSDLIFRVSSSNYFV